MQTAIPSPRPYLLNRAGGTVPIRAFTLHGDELKVEPQSDRPLTGTYHLVYRCKGHENSDIRLAVASDGSKWSILEKPPQQDLDVCYPEPGN